MTPVAAAPTRPTNCAKFVGRTVSTSVLAALLLAQPQPGFAQHAAGRLSVTEVWVADGYTRLEGLTRVAGAAESRLGTVWITSARPARLLVVDPSGDGGHDFIAAKDGDGPGELAGPNRLAVMPDGNVAVYDLRRKAVEIFSPDGKPVRRVRLPLNVSWPKGFAALASGGFALSGGVMGNDFAIHQFDESGRYVRSWSEATEAEEWMARLVGTGGALHALPDGSLLYSRGAPHEIVRYDIPSAGGGEPRGHTIAAVEDLLDAPGDDVLIHGTEDGIPFTTFDVWYPQSRAVFGLEDGRVLNVITRSDGDQPRTIWQLFESGQLSGTGGGPLVVETQTDGRIYEPWFLCSNGDILASRRDPVGVTTIVRLRLTLDGERLGA